MPTTRFRRFTLRFDGRFAALALLALLVDCRSSPPTAAAKPEASEPQFVPAGDVRLWVRSVGAGPTLVVINGGPGASHHAIARLESLASPSLRVVLYDQRGMGGSSAPADDGAYRLDNYVADLDAVRDGLGVAKIHVLGHSFGGLVAMAYAAAHPERVASLTLVSSGAPSWDDHEAGNVGFSQRYAKLLAEKKIPADPPPAVRDDCREQSSAFLPILFADPDFKGPMEETKTTSCSVRVREATVKLMPGYDLRPKLKTFAAPTLVVIGDADPFGDARATVKAFESAHPQYAVVPKCGHFPWVECPDAFRPVVEEFLARVAQR
jgi:proline iminopeptidase